MMNSSLLLFMLVTALNSALFLGIIFPAFRLLRKVSAAFRYQLLVCVFVGLLALPFLFFVLPTWNLPVGPDQFFLNRLALKVAQLESNTTSLPSNHNGTEDITAETNPAAGGQSAQSAGTGEKTENRSFSAQETRQASAREFSPFFSSILMNINKIIFSIWCAGALAILILQLVRWAGAGFIVEMATEVDNRTQKAIAEKIRWDMGIKKPVSLLRSEMAAVTMAWGILKPHIILPPDSETWSAEKTEAILRHEMAHIKRRDNMFHFLAIFICAFYWFNPLVWRLMRRFHLEREIACDNYVLNSGTIASSYAKHLMEISLAISGSRSRKIIPAVMAHSSDIKKRLLTVLNPESNRKPVGFVSAVVCFFLIVCLTLPVAAFRPWSDISDGGAGKTPASAPVVITTQSPSTQQENKDLFSVEYYKQLKKNKYTGKYKKTIQLLYDDTSKNVVLDKAINIQIEPDPYANLDWSIDGTIKKENDLVTIEDAVLRDEAGDYVIEGKNAVLDPDSPLFCTFDSKRGYMTVKRHLDRMTLEYKVVNSPHRSEDAVEKSFYIDGEQHDFGDTQIREFRYVSGMLTNLLSNSKKIQISDARIRKPGNPIFAQKNHPIIARRLSYEEDDGITSILEELGDEFIEIRDSYEHKFRSESAKEAILEAYASRERRIERIIAKTMADVKEFDDVESATDGIRDVSMEYLKVGEMALDRLEEKHAQKDLKRVLIDFYSELVDHAEDHLKKFQKRKQISDLEKAEKSIYLEYLEVMKESLKKIQDIDTDSL